MAEGMLGGILGEEDEKPEVEAAETLTGADAFAVAVAAKLAGNDPGVARKTEEFLSDQSAQALPLYQEAARLDLHYWVGYNNIILALVSCGDVEGAIRVGERMMQLAGGRPGKAPELMYGVYDFWVNNLLAERTAAIADLIGTGGTSTTQSGADGLGVAQLDILLHEPDTARLRLQTTTWDEQLPPDAASAAFVRAILAEEVRDFPTAAAAWDRYAMAYADPGGAAWYPNGICYAAVTFEKTGQPHKADAALSAVGKLTFPDCYAFQADVLDLRGDWDGAQAWYAKAVKLAPSFPGAYYSWGLALAKHNNLKGAVEQFRIANVKGPTWADPVKAWGDVLVKMGNPKEALAKYDEALRYAPNWKQLKEAREAVAQQKS